MLNASKLRDYKQYHGLVEPTLIDELSKLESIAVVNSSKDDVFSCEHGVKQIQNLHKLEAFAGVVDEIQSLLSDRLLGGRKLNILNMQYFIKHPNYKITSAHQDGAYFNAPEKKIVTVWIPLQDVSVESSCLHYINEKLSTILEHRPTGTNVRTRTGTTGYSQYTDSYPLESFSPVEMKKGDLLLHNQFALHYANENKTNERRIAFTTIVEII